MYINHPISRMSIFFPTHSSSQTHPPIHQPKPLLHITKITFHHITSIRMSKLITVFGATGNQGGSVIKHILADAQLSSEFKIRGITRDVNKPAAKALADKGVELTTVSLLSSEKHLESTYIC